MKNSILLFCFFLIMKIGSAQNPADEFSYTKKTEYNEQVVYRSSEDTTINRYEKIVINGFDSKVPFYHFINKDNKAKFVFLLHGIGSSKNEWFKPASDEKLLDSLIALGYDVIVPDAKYHGERSYELNFRPAYALPGGIRRGSEEDANSLYQVYTVSIKDFRIIMDYLEKKYNNTDLQFDFIGYSMGGALSLLISAADKRVNSVVACVPPLDLPYAEIKGLDRPIDFTKKLKAITPLFYGQFLNAPTSLIMGRSDPFTSEQVVAEFYNRIPLNDKELIFYESGHALPAEYVDEVIKWIGQHNNE